MWNVADVIEVYQRIKPYIRKTPLIACDELPGLDREVYFKAECFQKTGSFKVRGGVNAISRLSQEQRAKGVVTASSGSHGKAVAYAAKVFGISATVVLPGNPNPVKKQAIEEYGARTVLHPGTSVDQLEKAHELEKEENLTFVHSFNAPEIFLGQGTVALEILEDLPDVANIVVPIGGGGLITGILTVVKEAHPEVKVIGVQPTGCDSLYRSLQAGKITAIERSETIAEGLSCTCPEDPTFSIMQKYVDDVVTVDDDEIKSALESLLLKGRVLAEPSGAAATAALLYRKLDLRPGKTVSVVSGGNVDSTILREILGAHHRAA